MHAGLACSCTLPWHLWSPYGPDSDRALLQKNALLSHILQGPRRRNPGKSAHRASGGFSLFHEDEYLLPPTSLQYLHNAFPAAAAGIDFRDSSGILFHNLQWCKMVLAAGLHFVVLVSHRTGTEWPAPVLD